MEIFVEEKLTYEAPEIEIVEIEVEVGFAASDGGPGGTLPGDGEWEEW